MSNLQRNLYKPFLRHFCAIGDSCANIFYAKMGILCDDLLHAHSTGEKIEDKRNPNSRAADTGFSKTDIRIYRDTVKKDLPSLSCSFLNSVAQWLARKLDSYSNLLLANHIIVTYRRGEYLHGPLGIAVTGSRPHI